MFTLIFIIFLFLIFGKVLLFALKAAWGIGKIVLSVVFLPLILLGLVMAGLFYIAVPILVIVGVITVAEAITG